jgi:hypothetical protein
MRFFWPSRTAFPGFRFDSIGLNSILLRVILRYFLRAPLIARNYTGLARFIHSACLVADGQRWSQVFSVLSANPYPA